MVILDYIIMYFILGFSVIVHECSHGIAAHRMGDPTAYLAGRITLNPIKHIDPIWTVIMPIMLLLLSGGRFIFGGAKPVPINPYYFRNPDKGMMITGLSGPLSNFILASIGFAGFVFVFRVLPIEGFALLINAKFFAYMIIVNVVLGVFNLIPIPPLDGSRVLRYFMPYQMRESYDRMEQFGLILVIFLVASGGTIFISGILQQIFNLLVKIAGQKEMFL